MMKKLGGILITALIVCTMLMLLSVTASAVTASGECGGDGDVRWELNGDTLRIYGHGNMKDYTGWRQTPWYQYRADRDVKHIIVEDGITSVGAYVFAYFYYVEDISLGKDLLTIHDYAFYEATYYSAKDVDLVIPASVYEIRDYAFAYALHLKNLYIKWDYTSLPKYVPGWGITGLDIRQWAFYDCENLETVAIGTFKKNGRKDVRIWKGAFEKCYQLDRFYFSDSLASVGEEAFHKCDKLREVYYFGERNNFPRDQISNNKNKPLFDVINGQVFGNSFYCVDYIDKLVSDDNDHWRDAHGMPLYDVQRTPHTFGMTIADKYKKAGSDLIYYMHCVVCDHIGPNTFSMADHPATTHLTTETKTLLSGWYVVDGELDYGGARLEIDGDVKLILRDGCGITTSGGIHVGRSKKLTIYSETIDLSDNNSMGYIHVTGAPEFCAGIGSNGLDTSGEVIICGGNIESCGGRQSAGIGSGLHGSGSITIRNGRVTGWGGEYAAGIGGGMLGSARLWIEGGFVRGYGQYGAAGIGCSMEQSMCVGAIKGGTIKAWSGWANAIGEGMLDCKANISISGLADVESHPFSDWYEGGAYEGGRQEPELFEPLLLIINEIEQEETFADISAGDYFYDAVLWADDAGITDGVDALHFAPDAPVTRAQVVTFLWRAAGCPAVNFAMNMADVSPDAYYAEAVRWALSEGITKGTSDTAFSPDAVCTRGQIVTLLARYAGVLDAQTVSVFTDVRPTDYFAAAVKWAKDNGVTSGLTPTTFGPNGNCTRAQVVTFLYRWMVR